jgi:transposase-like protein
MENKRIKKGNTVPPKRYSENFKRTVVREYEKGFLNKDQIQQKYSIGGNSRILTWCRKYGKFAYPEKGINIGRPMKDPHQQRIKELEKELADTKLKVLAYETLISITEKEEGIVILKKDAAKQLKSLHKRTHGK